MTTRNTALDAYARTERRRLTGPLPETPQLADRLTDGIREWRHKVGRKQPVPGATPAPGSCFVFADKIVSGPARFRCIPISGDIGTLVEACGSVFGGHLLLPFLKEGKVMPLSGLPMTDPSRSTGKWAGLKQAGRTAAYNAIGETGAGEVILNGFMGHGPSLFQPGACLFPLGLDDQFRLLGEVVFPMYREYGINELALLIAEKLHKLVDREACANTAPLMAPSHAPVRRVGDFTEVEARDTGFRFLSQAEIFWALTLESPDSKDNSDGRRKRQKSSVLNGIPLNTSGLMILLALEGVPVQSLVRLHHFYQLGNFLLDQASGNIYFLVLVENNKVGGLSAVPVLSATGRRRSTTGSGVY